jgi:hypothetical protein
MAILKGSTLLLGATAPEARRLDCSIDGAERRHLHTEDDGQIAEDQPPVTITDGSDGVQCQEERDGKACPWGLTPASVPNVCGAAAIHQERAPVWLMLGEKHPT